MVIKSDTGTALSKSYQFESDQIKFKCVSAQRSSQNNQQRFNLPVEGYSGSPMILIAAETGNLPQYCFMIGIFYGKY